MNNQLLLLLKKHTDTLTEQTKTKPQETLEFEVNKQLETFLFNPPINLVEEGKNLLAVIFEATNSVFNIASEKTTVFQLLYQVIGILDLFEKTLKN